MAIRNLSDFTLENHLSIVLLRPNTVAASEWLRDTAPADTQFFGPALAIEPPYVAGVIGAAHVDGFTVGAR
jgi:hypothetical protein